ncbi:lipid IV(A) 3-deoxy-D-manno-octulosonic acid transferase [Glaciimonas sp. PCH181]|uniref:lipid IV(A) 3-deoxy-D-manno-octulosonic acid transferase n=1 Tax=Glaciimonas sp. PCH181 TaxID=2133943 RepID=UPI000D34E53C|nr:lipid IV(A) 3-deoxy-D-manno-octulosonic acid transferase [Glaciimonas sp. PCH181]PUA20514.1 3-deoxy-D-manno-octulosonic acid transferase [Glaciimonas sp. PCH181]
MRARLYRLLYSCVWWLIIPLALCRLWWRGRKEPGYRQHIPERLGFYPPIDRARADLPPAYLWVHAVSVGETRAAEPLINMLLAGYPQHTILLTHMTATGRATGQALFGTSSRVIQSFLPYDTGWMVGRFLRHFSPRLCILMETEVWPNLIAQCGRYQVPVALVNARLSARSLRRGKKFTTLMTEAASGISCVGAQTSDDAERMRELGARNVTITGNLKFDVAPSEELVGIGKAMRQQIGARPVLLCASTREGEEALILAALSSLPPIDDLLLIIVPRHPQRFEEVANLIASYHLPMLRRSVLGSEQLGAEIKVMLGDSMGEMFAYFGVSDVAFIGGSLMPLGGQNLIEACAVGTPVLIGPHTFNFAAVTEQAIAAGAALRVSDAVMMLGMAKRLLVTKTERQAMGQNASNFAQLHRGATARTVALLAGLL